MVFSFGLDWGGRSKVRLPSSNYLYDFVWLNIQSPAIWLCMIKYINDLLSCINLELICSCTKKNCHKYLEFMSFWIIWSCVKWNRIAKIDALSIDPWSFFKLWQELWWSMIYPDLFMVAAADKMWLHEVSISSCTEQLLLWSMQAEISEDMQLWHFDFNRWDIRRHAQGF